MINSRIHKSEGRRQKPEFNKANSTSILLSSSLWLLFFCALLFPASGFSEGIVEVRSLRHWTTSEYVRIVIDLSGPVEFTKGKLSNPERVFFDLKNAKVMKGLQPNFAVNDKVLKSIRVGQNNANTARIVLDFETAEYDYKIFSLEDPSRLVIDVFSKGSDGKKSDNKTEANLSPNLSPNITRKLIVLDAGHGGHDSGAVGPNNLFEKDVVLDITLKARDILKKEFPQYEVILTRDTDVFIKLRDRAEIANRSNADLFISIHANASPKKKGRGIETYMLNWSGDAESMRVAARENSTVSKEEMQQIKNEVGFMLASLQKNLKHNESINIAGSIQNSLVSKITSQYPKVTDHGVKGALFYVLAKTTMAASLVEVSFIDHPEESKLLATDEYRDKLARSIVSGINSYFTTGPQSQMKMATAGSSSHANYKVSPASYSSSDR